MVSDEEHDELWRFAVISMAVITALNEAEFETNVNNCYLSIDNEKRLNVLFQLVICFGIHYNLEDNIGKYDLTFRIGIVLQLINQFLRS